MVYPQFLELASLCLGLVSSVMFSIGACTLTREEAKKIATPLHGENLVVTNSLILQKFQFFLGAIILAISFLLQLVKALALPPSSTINAIVQQIHVWHIVSLSLVILVLAICYSIALTKRLLST